MPTSRTNPLPGFHLRLLCLVLGLATTGCTNHAGLPQILPGREARMHNGYLYYVDGAGGGTAKNNWASGVRQGLIEAGYTGAGEMYSWETGDGLLIDQVASVEYKRKKAAGLAAEITKRKKAFPAAPINVLGFSAGTAETIFALEALPPAVQVRNVVLLGCSLSENYALTKALRRIDGKLYVFTSKHDRVIGDLMPLSGTTDRKFNDPGAGINGFVLPAKASAETRALYKKKVVTIKWRKAEERDGDYARHFDNIKAPFIRDYVAPYLSVKQPQDG